MPIDLNNLTYNDIRTFYGPNTLNNEEHIKPSSNVIKNMGRFYLVKQDGHRGHVWAAMKNQKDETILKVYLENRKAKPKVQCEKNFKKFLKHNAHIKKSQEQAKELKKCTALLTKMAQGYNKWEEYKKHPNR